ncbi:apolipoprotein N-acyltransferase, partial [candidate division GN15 bacterium]|nr:apolipoprotein N-acyltransferase [candidate division GN15 bacterium]
LLSLAYYPYHLGFLAWLALVRPLMIISRLPRAEAFGSAYLFGFGFSLFSLYWIAQVTPPGMITAVFFVAFYYAIVFYVINRLYAVRPVVGLIGAPLIWVGMEYFRTLTQFAFPWSDLGYTQAHYLYILQIVSVTSVHGLSLLIVAVNVLLWQVLESRNSIAARLTFFWSSVGVVLLLIAYGWIVMPAAPLPGKYPVAMLQGSVALEEKWRDGNEDQSLHLYDSLARDIAAEASADEQPRLYVWPETSAPAYLSHDNRRRTMIGRTALATDAYHLVGALGATVTEEHEWHHNSCYLFSPQGRMVGRYDKVRLVPFTEQVPYQDRLPFLRREVLTEYLTFIETYNVRWWSDFRPGESARLFTLQSDRGEDTQFGVLICFESTFPEYSRAMIHQGAHFILGITNDTWFGRSVGVHMHSRIFLTRAVETRCWMVRVANSGLSYIVDGHGRIREDIPLYDVAGRAGAVRKLEDYSVFVEHGDVVGLVSFLLTVLATGILIVWWFVDRLRRKSTK